MSIFPFDFIENQPASSRRFSLFAFIESGHYQPKSRVLNSDAKVKDAGNVIYVQHKSKKILKR